MVSCGMLSFIGLGNFLADCVKHGARNPAVFVVIRAARILNDERKSVVRGAAEMVQFRNPHAELAAQTIGEENGVVDIEFVFHHVEESTRRALGCHGKSFK